MSDYCISDHTLDDYWITNCAEDRAHLMLKVAAGLGIKMHTEPAYDVDGNLLKGLLAVHLDEGLCDLSDFWIRLAMQDKY